ncbi:MAG TPA: hypothetical protein VF680_04060 [Allosphingosinicella sp.]|jgi:hypothetical protein
MAREPHYPGDTPVGAAKPASESSAPVPAPVGEAAAAAASAKSVDGKRGKHLMTGAAIGIGSAAIVAALLYARRNKNDRGNG